MYMIGIMISENLGLGFLGTPLLSGSVPRFFAVYSFSGSGSVLN